MTGRKACGTSAGLDMSSCDPTILGEGAKVPGVAPLKWVGGSDKMAHPLESQAVWGLPPSLFSV